MQRINSEAGQRLSSDRHISFITFRSDGGIGFQLYKLSYNDLKTLLKNLSTDHIAEQLGLNPQTVRSQKSRAIQVLKTRLLKAGRLGAYTYLLG